MKRHLVAMLLALAPAEALGAPALELDHAILYAKPGAPERTALEKAGFVIAPTVNKHDGQGTASVTVEFLNGYLELLYPDASVAVAPGMEQIAQKFRDRANWRETGASPIGLQLRKTASAPASFPFPTAKIHMDWMGPDESLELLTPRTMPNAIGLSVPPHAVDEAANVALDADPGKGALFHHPNGARRITGMEVVVPSLDALPPAAQYVADTGAARFAVGGQWLMILTLDGGRRGVVRDLNPTLPLIVRY
jgi:Glyoxalase-like domain